MVNEIITSAVGPTIVVLFALLEVLIIVGAAYMISFVRKQIKESKVAIDASMEENIVETVKRIVKATNQKIVEDMKKASGNKKLSEEQQLIIFDTVKNNLLHILNSDEVKFLTGKYLNMDNALEYLIESAVADTKNTAFETTKVIAEAIVEEDRILSDYFGDDDDDEDEDDDYDFDEIDEDEDDLDVEDDSDSAIANDNESDENNSKMLKNNLTQYGQMTRFF